MNELAKLLMAWPGRRPTQARLHSKGYWIPQRFQELVLHYVPDCDEPSLQRYWDELAREYLCNGPSTPDNRKYNPEAVMSYRSSYLDELAALPENMMAEGPILSLHPSFRKFKEAMHNVPGVMTQVRDHLQEQKRKEVQVLNITRNGWTGTKGDFPEFLGRVAELRRFIFKKKKWRRVFCEHLEIVIDVDIGMRQSWQFQLPLTYSLTHLVTLDSHRFGSFASSLMPGIAYYGVFESPETAILGIQASVDLFATIGELTEECINASAVDAKSRRASRRTR